MLSSVAKIKLPEEVYFPNKKFGHVIVNININDLKLDSLKVKNNVNNEIQNKVSDLEIKLNFYIVIVKELRQ